MSIRCPGLAEACVPVVPGTTSMERLHTTDVTVALFAWQLPGRGAGLYLQCGLASVVREEDVGFKSSSLTDPRDHLAVILVLFACMWEVFSLPVVSSLQGLKNSSGKIFLVHHPEAWLKPMASCDAWKLFWLCLQVIQTAGFGLRGVKIKTRWGKLGFSHRDAPPPQHLHNYSWESLIWALVLWRLHKLQFCLEGFGLAGRTKGRMSPLYRSEAEALRSRFTYPKSPYQCVVGPHSDPHHTVHLHISTIFPDP